MSLLLDDLSGHHKGPSLAIQKFWDMSSTPGFFAEKAAAEVILFVVRPKLFFKY